MLEDRFGDKLAYSKPVEFANNESEFVYSLRTKFTPGIMFRYDKHWYPNINSRLEILQQEYCIISNFDHAPLLQIKSLNQKMKSAWTCTTSWRY